MCFYIYGDYNRPYYVDWYLQNQVSLLIQVSLKRRQVMPVVEMLLVLLQNFHPVSNLSPCDRADDILVPLLGHLSLLIRCMCPHHINLHLSLIHI